MARLGVLRFLCTHLLPVLPVLLWGCSGNDRGLSLPGPVTTVAGGYPLALQLQTAAAPGTFLTRVVVVLERQDNAFEVSRISYGFDGADERVCLVTIDNARRRAGVTNEVHAAFGGSEREPVGVAGKDVWEVLDIAKANGLNQFCAMVPEKGENILFQLESLEQQPVWHITADGWDERGLIAQLRMDVDQASGSVLKNSFRRAPGR